jgi:hypothetical protein
MKDRFVPLINNPNVRRILGLLLTLLSPVVAARILEVELPGLPLILSIVLFCWFPAVYLTDKYSHKYPQRYYSYLAASHLKAAVVMALGALAIRLVSGPQTAPGELLAVSLLLIVLGDAAISSLRRRAPLKGEVSSVQPSFSPAQSRNGASAQDDRVEIDTAHLLSQLDSRLPTSAVNFIHRHLPRTEGPNRSLLIVDDMPHGKTSPVSGQAGMLVGLVSLNNVRRLNLFLQFCTSQVAMGGYVALRYTPLEEVYADLRRRFPGVLYWPAFLAHFAWYRAIPKIPWLDKLYFARQLAWIDKFVLSGNSKRTRVLSKAEAWGRLAFYGMEVVAEQAEGSERLVLARRAGAPVENRKPSYYAVVALEKVGLDGERIRLHKVRSMYPFSEFLQKAVFESHGLSTTGKFKNDFRITEYGKLFRRHWIDELPGLFDWMRGDIKLVGMRATSPHFLSLYPREFYDLYIQIKPGLIPPIFDESTGGFDKIVEVEQTYLERYVQAPVRTDVSYFWYTFRDIFLRKVRSN